MKIIIPMSGVGQRFINAGYTDPKPLVEIDGMPIIEHVVNMYPGETDFIFICNRDHLETTNMRSILERIAPDGRIVTIEPHKKGPVYAVTQIYDMFGDDDEVIVNYCDFARYWNYQDFLNDTHSRKADGCITAYKGFHPHMLGTTNYAFMRFTDDRWMLEIKEKEPFTDNRMDEYASDGMYYFRRGEFVKTYFSRLIEWDINLNGEYYVSLVYNLLQEDGLKTSIYEIDHMLQWGTPQDVQEYVGWSNYYRDIIKFKPISSSEENCLTLIPMAGRGSRFVNEGYVDPKPLIEVNTKPMVVQAVSYLPQSKDWTFICLEDHLASYPIEDQIKAHYPQARIVSLNQVTEGQACTCELGLTQEDMDKPLLISASDNGVVWNAAAYQQLIDDDSVDCIAWTFRHHPSSQQNPQMYGWVKVDESNTITGVSVKVPISKDPFNDHAIVGTFYFRKARHFINILKRMYEHNIRVNNEFYVDSCLGELGALGLKGKVFEVDHYICWGTPNDLKTYNYWQQFFHKCAWHPYSMDHDPMRTL